MKKIITLLLTLIMAVSLGSCKNSKKNKIATANELRNYLDSIELKEDYNIFTIHCRRSNCTNFF